MKNLLTYVLVIVGICLIIYYIDIKPLNTKKVYLVDKYVDTVRVKGKRVPNGIYGISFYIVYQEDKTMERFTELVTKEEYNKAVINTNNIIQKQSGGEIGRRYWGHPD